MALPLRTVAVLAGLTIVPIGITWWLAERPDDVPGVTDRVSAVLVRPSAQVEDRFTPVDILLDWSPASTVNAPVGLAGFVTSVYVGPEDIVAIGDRVLSVDGVDRLAWHSSSPFYRVLRRNDTGPDVEELHRLLMFVVPELTLDGDTYTRETADAIDALAESLGAPDPHGVFYPSWIIWLSGDSSQVGDSSMRPGEPSPPPGATLWEEPLRLVSARVVQAGSGLDVARFDGLEWGVYVDGVELFVTTTASVGDPDSLDQLATKVEPSAEGVGGTIRLVAPVETLSVPVGSVQAGKEGQTCIWVPSGDGFESVAVETTGAGPGYAVISGVDVDTELLANPAFVLDDATCP